MDKMRSLVLLALLLLQLPVPTTLTGHWEEYEHHNNKSCCSWKCLLFTLQWPAGFCQSLNRETLCRIPESINTWTIHGLWPQRAHQCCNCWPMFHSDIQELEAELSELWPSLVIAKPSFQFWRDEWNKHGVCAACIEGMNSATRYFQICLKLRSQFDIHRLLEEAGITPSCERPYKVEEVRSVLVPHLSDRHEIQCVTDNKNREVWFQVKIPLSHNLTLGCGHHSDAENELAASSDRRWNLSAGHLCPPQVPFYYLPIDHQQPQQPCG